MSQPIDYRIAKTLGLVGELYPAAESGPLPIRNAPSPLRVFLPFIGQREERRKRRNTEQPKTLMGKVLQRMTLRADNQWQDSEITLSPGEVLSVSATGHLFISRALNVSIGPKTCLWYRVDDGDIHRLPSDTGTITSTKGGRLYFQVALPGAFGNRAGETSTESPPPPMSGTIDVEIYSGSGAEDSPELPQGWHYYWRLGEGSIYRKGGDDEPALCCDTHGDVGIIKYPIDQPLTDDMQFSWDWFVDALPSTLPEHVQPTHDYLSIAVEFENGLDLTYMWSSTLPADTIFQCPLPWWDKRETHWVLRRPEDGLSMWHHESRSIKDDYIKAIGGEVPKRIVAVWLIANSAFQSGHGKCKYRKIKLGPREAQQSIF
ncbi:Uncharacterised protein [Zhongshania aliphaticivorans]|uniref:DUF3047 domain-containing protein n=1 Tax=Zhongshania aliphaticivorans TaxID=1470434 RepID=A0A5S9MWB7_9GAMM|nr:DUF3047 domain-containing protein [Zhongshania aliphaticivorans]CAA0080650.1 Uncharacterised protein [Zhongshania aliphaticivorans]CAA0085603.1 Uncharacterised protein [Zhongshania aliphaticivorans]